MEAKNIARKKTLYLFRHVLALSLTWCLANRGERALKRKNLEDNWAWHAKEELTREKATLKLETVARGRSSSISLLFRSFRPEDLNQRYSTVRNVNQLRSLLYQDCFLVIHICPTCICTAYVLHTPRQQHCHLKFSLGRQSEQPPAVPQLGSLPIFFYWSGT